MMPIWPFVRRRPDAPPSAPLSPHPTPDRPVYAVGDVHGCLEKLDNLLDKISQDQPPGGRDLVFLGDYVDRGPQSAGVLARLRDLTEQFPDDVTCLLGNHDRMMLDFLDKPSGKTRGWLSVGGQDTLASFGLGSAPGRTLADKYMNLSRELNAALGDGMIAWLRSLPMWWRSGNLVAVHGQTDPVQAMDAQSEQVLLWGRPPLEPQPRRDGQWVVHGHTVVPEPRVAGGHVAIDTGAWRNGPLTAAVFDGGPVRFLMAH